MGCWWWIALYCVAKEKFVNGIPHHRHFLFFLLSVSLWFFFLFTISCVFLKIAHHFFSLSLFILITPEFRIEANRMEQKIFIFIAGKINIFEYVMCNNVYDWKSIIVYRYYYYHKVQFYFLHTLSKSVKH